MNCMIEKTAEEKELERAIEEKDFELFKACLEKHPLDKMNSFYVQELLTSTLTEPGYAKFFDFAIKDGVNIYQGYKHEQTLLTTLAWSGKTRFLGKILEVMKRTVCYLIDFKKHIDHQSLFGSALYLAATNGHHETVSLLLENKARVDARQNESHCYGETALCNAMRRYQDVNLEGEKQNLLRVAEVLLKHGADHRIEDRFGKSAYNYAQDDAMIGVIIEHSRYT